MSLLNKYIWVVNTLFRAGERGLSLKELNEKWLRNDMSYGEPISRQSFDRWKGGILDMMGVIIECHLKGGYRYYIYNPEILKDGQLNRWLLDTYTTVNTLTQNMVLKDRILTEEIPSNKDFLTLILDAMRDNKVMEITYRGFGKEKETTFTIESYCLKMFQKRWYLLAISTKEDKFRLYGVDRIEDAHLTNENFVFPDAFNAEEYFASYFGVVHNDKVESQRIVFRAKKHHQHYLRSLPLHKSQKEIFACEEYADFELCLRPTYDFCMELLRAGAMIEVLEPKSLRYDMHCWVRDLWNIYKND